MRTQTSALVLLLCISCGTTNASEELDVKKQTPSESPGKIKQLSLQSDLDSEKGYYEAVSALEKEHEGTLVETNLKKFLENPDKYLTLLTSKYLFRTEHSAHWLNKFAEATECAKKNDWKACEQAATNGLNEKADEPVLIFLRAIAHKKLNENKLSLDDLDRLYAIKAQRKDIKDHNKYYELEGKDFFNFLLI